MSPDYDEGTLIGTTEVIDVDVRGNGTLFVYPDVEGNPIFNYLVNDVSPTADETFFFSERCSLCLGSRAG